MFPSRKVFFGFIYGLTSGLVYAVAAWGIDAFIVSAAHLAYPWLSFGMGLALALLLGGVAGYVTVGFENAVVGVISWLAAGFILALAGAWIPLWVVPGILPTLEPVLTGWLKFGWQDSYSILAFSCVVASCVAFLILGLLENVLLDQAAFSPYGGAILMPLIICALVAGVAGGVVDSVINSRQRDSLVALDKLITFAIDNRGVEVDKTLARQIHLGAINSIRADLSRDRRLFYFWFNETRDQGQILADFEGHWALCDLFLDQPSFCRPVEPPQ